MLDTFIRPLYNKNNGSLPLLIADPPIGCDRNRSTDQMMILLAFDGSSSILTQDETDEFLHTLASEYYQSRSSVTGAIREVAEQVERWVATYNANLGDPSNPATASLTVVVVHQDQLYIGQSGKGYFLLKSQQNIYDYENEHAAGPLGNGDAIRMKFHHTQVKSGDVLLVSLHKPSSVAQPSSNGATEIWMNELSTLPEDERTSIQLTALSFDIGSGVVHKKTDVNSRKTVKTLLPEIQQKFPKAANLIRVGLTAAVWVLLFTFAVLPLSRMYNNASFNPMIANASSGTTPTPAITGIAVGKGTAAAAPNAAAVPKTKATQAVSQQNASQNINPTQAAPVAPVQVTVAANDKRPKPSSWKRWDTYPKLSKNAIQIYKNGIKKGTNPRALSLVGDSMSLPDIYLGVYTVTGYKLSSAEKTYQKTITYFSSSFGRKSIAVNSGVSAQSVLTTAWSDEALCLPNESALSCELRLNNPSIVLIELGTSYNVDNLIYLRSVVETVLQYGALPILATKADNHEGDYHINLEIATVAYEKNIPLWNFWRTAQKLPNQGLDAEQQNIALSNKGMQTHRLSALKLLNSVRKQLAK